MKGPPVLQTAAVTLEALSHCAASALRACAYIIIDVVRHADPVKVAQLPDYVFDYCISQQNVHINVVAVRHLPVRALTAMADRRKFIVSQLKRHR